MMTPEQLRELNETAQMNEGIRDAVRDAQRAVLDLQPDDVRDEWLNGPKTYLFEVKPGDSAWLPLGEYLLQIYEGDSVTLAWREKVGGGTWGPPLGGRKA